MVSYGEKMLKCPVGGELIGSRKPWEPAAVYCRDCNATYVYEPHNVLPSSNFKGKIEDKGCHCEQCKVD